MNKVVAPKPIENPGSLSLVESQGHFKFQPGFKPQKFSPQKVEPESAYHILYDGLHPGWSSPNYNLKEGHKGDRRGPLNIDWL